MKRSKKEIKVKIKEFERLATTGKMGGYRANEFADALRECLEMDEEEINNKIDEIIETDYKLYAVYDWAIEGRDNC